VPVLDHARGCGALRPPAGAFWDRTSWIVEVRVERVVAERLAALTADARPARFVAEEDLDWFNEVAMDLILPPSEKRGDSDG
jgi:hypothetical protein